MRYWNTTEVAKYLGLGKTAFWRLRGDDKTFPKPKKVLGQIGLFFAPAAVKAWQAAQDEKEVALATANAKRLRATSAGARS
jgi:predicted DNA-binding transcriptional regulator AlpA